MICPKCQIENIETRNFCKECGAKLKLSCPECGFQNIPGDKFCGECGHQLTKSIDPPPIDYTNLESYTPKSPTERILTNCSSIGGEAAAPVKSRNVYKEPEFPALISCPECKKKISETLASCSYCGYVFKDGQIKLIREKEKAKVKKIILGIFIVFAGILVLVFLLNGGGKRISESFYNKGYSKGQAIAAVSLANYDQAVSLFGTWENYKKGLLEKAAKESGYTGKEADEYRKGIVAGFEAEVSYIKKHGKPSIK